MSEESYFEIDPDPDTAKRIRKERDKARELKKSPWWKNKLHKGICHYCGQQFSPDQLSMDHIVPLARGGKSTKGNIVPACAECNRKKKLETPAEAILRKISGPSAPQPDS
jgi:5-methylcytosine-specific restriction endonuclease McrA